MGIFLFFLLLCLLFLCLCFFQRRPHHKLIYDGQEESDCFYVSSRGILKSCPIHSPTPISSVRDLQDMDVSKFYDGMILYVCISAVPRFIHDIVPRIPSYYYILVSGDDDSSTPWKEKKISKEYCL